MNMALNTKNREYFEMKKNDVLIEAILIDAENIDRTFSGLFDSFTIKVSQKMILFSYN